jgi:hypothetical protein
MTMCSTWNTLAMPPASGEEEPALRDVVGNVSPYDDPAPPECDWPLGGETQRAASLQTCEDNYWLARAIPISLGNTSPKRLDSFGLPKSK